MAIMGLVVGLCGLGAVCWLLLWLAAYALPFCAGLTAGLAALHGGAGIGGAFIVGIFAAGVTLALGRIAFATVRQPFLRALIGLLFAVPAAIAGHQVSLGLAKVGVTDDGWREAFALIGSVLIGVTAFVRTALLAPPPTGRGLGASAHSSSGSQLRDQIKT